MIKGTLIKEGTKKRVGNTPWFSNVNKSSKNKHTTREERDLNLESIRLKKSVIFHFLLFNIICNIYVNKGRERVFR